MKIGIVGAGGVGGYLGAKLVRAGVETAILARGEQLAAIRSDGLRLVDPDGDLTVRPETVGDDPAILGKPDLLVVAVKAHQLAATIDQIRPAVGPQTRVLPFQNGVDGPSMVAEAFGTGRALIGIARIFANITAPGVITRYGTGANFTVGTPDGAQSGVRDIIETFRAAGIAAPDHPDVRVDLWTKFIMFNAMSGLTAATRRRFGELRADPDLLALARRLMEETARVGAAEGVPVGAAQVESGMHVFEKVLPADGRASTAHDLEQGRALEIDHLCGAVARRGRALGIDVTASETVYAILKPWKNGAA